MKTTDPVYSILAAMLTHSPESSYQRLNPALRSTLHNCIAADLPFQPATFARIYNELRGGWWFGSGAGSHTGEGFYRAACDCNHASAQQSFEAWAKRPGVLWEEDGPARRLCVGSDFTWKGRRLIVTSIREDSLVACTYKDYAPEIEGLKPGAHVGDWLILSAKKDGKATALRVIAHKKTYGPRRCHANNHQLRGDQVVSHKLPQKPQGHAGENRAVQPGAGWAGADEGNQLAVVAPHRS